MAFTLQLCVFAFALALTLTAAQQAYSAGCGVALQDIPNPASDSCTAFFRCYNYRQYSLRCPLGQAFDFDRSRCRPEDQVNCPLQLQRFQAPGVPSYMRYPSDQPEREVEIRVVHVPQGIDPNNIQFLNNGRQIPVTRQVATQGGQTLTGTQPQATIPAQNPQPVFGTVQGQVLSPPGQVQIQLPPGQGQGQVQGQAQGQANIPLFVLNGGGQDTNNDNSK